MQKDFTNRSAIVTGGGTGIGYATAVALAGRIAHFHDTESVRARVGFINEKQGRAAARQALAPPG